MSKASTNDYFSILTVASDISIWDEALGTKPKFWIEQDNERWLFKYARENTGEDWSEKLAFEIANAIGIQAAHVELAVCAGQPGTLSRSFIDKKKNQGLIHGNEILAGQVFGYDPDKRFGQSDHTLDNIQTAIGKLFDSSQEQVILQCLASYLVLDGLIGNTDRHHENWGLLHHPEVHDGRVTGRVLLVAPTFDHASSLGRELRDDRIEQMLRDPQGVVNYVHKGKGAIYRSSTGKRGENPLELAKLGYQRYPHLFHAALQRLRAVPLAELLALVDRIPLARMSPLANRFVKALLTYTYGQLCNLAT